MSEYLVLADDATGALDTGVRFAQRGIQTFVGFDALCEAPPGTRALVLDLATRHGTADEAAAAVREAALRHGQRGVVRFYKKTDSVLRGHVGAELASLQRAVGGTLCFAPFYPAQGRATRGGAQYVGGVRADFSPFARDPENPVRQADIRALLEAEGLSVRVVAPPYRLPDALPDALIFDGESEEDMASAARLLRETGLDRLLAGCAGLAGHIAPAGGCPPDREFLPQPVLIVSGSAAETTLRQIDAARGAGVAVGTPEYRSYSDGDAEPLLQALHAELAQGRSALLASAVRSAPLHGDLPKGLLQSRLAEWTRVLLEGGGARAWMAVGGDFLAEALRRMGIRGIAPLREVAPGVVLSRAGGRLLATKSGGFGEEHLLRRIAEGEIR